MLDHSCLGCHKQSELNSLRAAVKRFEDGRQYQTLLDERDKARQRYARCEEQRRQLSEENRKLKTENRSLLSSEESTRMRYERLLSVYDSLQGSFERQKAIESDDVFKRIEQVIDSLNDTVVHLLEQNEKDQGMIRKLKAQITKDNTNSSIPSSQRPNHRTPPNNREKTDKKPGAQKGHPGHRRKMLTPTAEPHLLPAPEEVLNDPEYYNTGKRIIKQLIRVAVHLEVDQYEADIYRHHKTRRKIHAPFPEGLVNELEYDASVSAFICLLHSHGNMSYDKIIEILSDLTDGRLRPSKGMIANLEKKFSDRSARDRQEIFNRMLVHPYMHIDGTTVRVNGKNGQVLIETSPAGTLLYYTGVKGDEAVKGTPIEEYDGTAVHDGESAFFHYGGSHQGCLVHELRYLKGSMDNEPELTWASHMREFLQFMIHHVKEVIKSGRKQLTAKEIQELEDQYDSILAIAEKEYESHPPDKRYYIEGYNTMKRLRKNRSAYLYFLHDLQIPYQNNPAEQAARKEKMHSKQSGGYRSTEYAQYHCDVLSVMESNVDLGISRYSTLHKIFKRR